MKTTKKILAIFISTIFIILNLSFVQAAVYSTKISAEVITNFTFSFPQSTTIEFKKDSTSLGYLYVKDFNLPEGYALLVNIENTPFINDNNPDSQIPYKCNYKTILIKSSEDLYPLNIIIDPIYWGISTAGHYTSIITFTLTITKL